MNAYDRRLHSVAHRIVPPRATRAVSCVVSCAVSCAPMTVEYARCPKPTESAGAKAKELGESAVEEDANRFKECLSAIFVFRVFFFFF